MKTGVANYGRRLATLPKGGEAIVHIWNVGVDDRVCGINRCDSARQ